MVAQTTDSGSSNSVLAQELRRMFMDANTPHYWNSSRNQIRCYCHKLALTVKAGMNTIGFGVGQTKPSAPTGKRLRLLLPDDCLPPPKIVLPDGTILDEEDADKDQEETDLITFSGDPGPNTAVENDDDSEGEDYDDDPDYKNPKPAADLVPRALTNVSPFLCLILWIYWG